MRAELINPFVRSLQNTFTTMLNCPVRRTNVTVKEGCGASHEISGVIGLTGKAVGAVVLSLSREVALKAASTLLCTEISQIDEEVLDAVGELTNMVAGRAKAELEEFELAVSLPNVITGTHHEVHFPSNIVPISIHFTCAWGSLTLEVGLALLPASNLNAPSQAEFVRQDVVSFS